MVAKVAILKKSLKHFISTGIRLGHTRRKEERQQLRQRFTKATRLRLPLQEGDDIILEVWLHPSFGQCISIANKLNIEELRGLLGENLFMAMKASKRRKEEELAKKETLTSAVKVLPDSSGNRKLKVTISFNSGIRIWGDAFPPYDS